MFPGPRRRGLFFHAGRLARRLYEALAHGMTYRFRTRYHSRCIGCDVPVRQVGQTCSPECEAFARGFYGD